MKKLLFAALLCLAFTNCKKDSAYKYSGTIVNYDYATCACCGGYVVKIDGNDSSFRASSFPPGSSIDSTHFPIKVNLNYVETGSCGTNHFISISSMIVVY